MIDTEHPDSPWRKSSLSFSNGGCAEVAAWRTGTRCQTGECVELAAWRKSRRSMSNGQCAEVGSGPAVVGVRDSKDAGGPVLVFSGDAWGRWLGQVKRDAGVAH